ncbi:hypothetical protein ACQP2F_29695 [Actinoplanes sp. CA-030573]|uniref:hypothetical protein n=1 Tax=Actinoplanes sp. CA-030573 TaxID=3239898 RepID=UPI003D8C515C
MAVSVEPGLTGGWRGGSNVLLLVRSPEDAGLVRSALVAATRDIAALGAAYVPPPVAVPAGHLLTFDFGTVPAASFRSVPELIARRLTEAGVGEAALGVPGKIGDRYAAVTALAPAARAWLRGPLGAPLGPAPLGADPLLEIAAAWVWATAPELPPQGVVISAEFELAWPGVTEALRPALAMHVPVAIVASDFASTATVAAVEGTLLGAVKQATLTAAGQDVAAAMRGQRDLLAAHAGELAWAGVDAVPTAREALSAQWSGRRPAAEYVPDLLVPEAMWFQVLSPGHLDRLGGPPPGAVPLPGGRAGLTVGEPEQWLPGHPAGAELRERARGLLAACLADEETGMALTRERLAEARARDREGFFRRR